MDGVLVKVRTYKIIRTIMICIIIKQFLFSEFVNADLEHEVVVVGAVGRTAETRSWDPLEQMLVVCLQCHLE